jgi:hypothetical protein
MVSVTLIIEAFEHVAKSPFLIMESFLGNYIFSLFHLGGCHGILISWSPSGKWFLLRDLLEGSSYHSHSHLPLSHERMGHIGEKGRQAMHNKDVVEDFPE